MNKNSKLEDSLNKIFSTSGYKMIDVSSKEITHRKALASGEIILGTQVIEMIKSKKMPKGDPLFYPTFSRKLEIVPRCTGLVEIHPRMAEIRFFIRHFRGNARIAIPAGIASN